jgi:hypothetical protein
MAGFGSAFARGRRGGCNLRCRDPARWWAARGRVPVAVRGVVHELVQGERVLRLQKLLGDALPCRGRGVAPLCDDRSQTVVESCSFRRRQAGFQKVLPRHQINAHSFLALHCPPPNSDAPLLNLGRHSRNSPASPSGHEILPKPICTQIA